VNLWGNVSNTLKNYSSVLFELWNEPNSGTAEEEALWFNVTQQCINAIRSTGATQPIVIEYGYGISYCFGIGVVSDMSWAFNYPLNDATGNLIFSTHLYAGTNTGFYTTNYTW
jgi:hypothetical protein